MALKINGRYIGEKSHINKNLNACWLLIVNFKYLFRLKVKQLSVHSENILTTWGNLMILKHYHETRLKIEKSNIDLQHQHKPVKGNFEGRPLNYMRLKFSLTQEYIKDTGLIIVLILLLIAYWKGELYFILPAIGTLIVVMTVPVVIKPLAVIWFYFSTTVGNVTNRIVFTVIYWVVLTPVSVMRKCLGFDPMRLKGWKNGVHSVFTERNHSFTSDDFSRPY